MSFRPFSLGICRGGLALFVFLACIRSLRAEDTSSRSIEIVPARGATINTNVDQFQSPDSPDLNLFSHAANPPQANQAGTPIILPPPQTATPTERERDLIDRRKNWVFMTPEDMSGQSSEKDISIIGDDKSGNGNRSTTAMQRFYQHLYDSDQAMATNQLGKLDSNDRNTGTNSAGAAFQNSVGNDGSASNPFNTISEGDAFRSARPTVFSDIFGSDTGNNTPNSENVRLKAEQKAHMDDFKELWNIDQPSAAPASASTPSSVGSGSVFGTPQGGQAFIPAGLPNSGSFQAQPTTTFQPVVPPSRIAPPPRADFAPQQRPF